MSSPQVPPVPYVAGTIVRSSAAFVDENSDPADPTVVTASALYGSPRLYAPVALTVVRDGIGLYHAEVPTSAWEGPGNQVVTVSWAGTGALAAEFTDVFTIEPTASGATDSAGP